MTTNNGFWRVDTHIHTCASPDAVAHPREVIRAARQKGLDRICITDHNTIEGALVGQALAPEMVIVGEEILTAAGTEILAFFVREPVPPRLSIGETLDRLEAQGAVISISHPFDPHRNTTWSEAQLEEILPRLDAIEGFNARTLSAAVNEQAIAFATAHHLPTTTGSDAHTPPEVGTAYLEMPPFTTADQFRAGLAQATGQGQRSPGWVHLLTVVNKWRTRFGWKPAL